MSLDLLEVSVNVSHETSRPVWISHYKVGQWAFVVIRSSEAILQYLQMTLIACLRIAEGEIF